MKRQVDFGQTIKTLRGETMRETMRVGENGTAEETVEMTLGHCCLEALNIPPERGQTPPAKETVRKGKLMWRIYDAKEPLTLDSKDIDLLKEQTHKRYPVPLVYMQIVEMLDPDEAGEEKEE